jgi:hypothetical protein
VRGFSRGDLAADRRRQALYSIDQLRRAAHALTVAGDGEPREMQAAVLIAMGERLESMLRELKAIA